MIFKDKKAKVIIVIFLLLFIIQSGILIGNKIRKKNMEKKDETKLSIKTESNIFKLDSIYLYSSANAITSQLDEKNNITLNIYQYTDISIKIDNLQENPKDENTNQTQNETTLKTELTTKNTVKEIYIDNFKLPYTPIKGTPCFYYKNPENFGKGELIKENKINDKINYTISTNNDIDFEKPNFYTDCSNPLTLSYINENVYPDFKVDNNNTSISFDGSLLRDSSILLSQIEASVSFTIHIINYENEEFTCDVSFNIPLENNDEIIYSGSCSKEITKFRTNKFYKTETKQ